MSSWTPSNPCPACGRPSGIKVKCENCQTLGCSNGNCRHGGTNTFCPICQKLTKKVKI